MPRQKNQTGSNGFAVPIQSDTKLGNAILIAEDDEGNYVATISEAKETAQCDCRGRMRQTEIGGQAGLCPARYNVWARGIGGEYRIAIDLPDLSQIGSDTRTASNSGGRCLCSEAKYPLDEADLSNNVFLCQPTHLSLADHVHRLVPLDRSQCTID